MWCINCHSNVIYKARCITEMSIYETCFKNKDQNGIPQHHRHLFVLGVKMYKKMKRTQIHQKKNAAAIENTVVIQFLSTLHYHVQ